MAWFVTALHIMPFAGGIWYGLDQQVNYQQVASKWHTDRSRSAVNQIERVCRAKPPGDWPSCIKQEVSDFRLKDRDNEREYADLVAQQTAALWATLMGIAALIAMTLNVVGIVFVWTTFRETKRTNEIALGESARATRRALAGAKETVRALQIAERNAEATLLAVRETARGIQIALEQYKMGFRPWLIGTGSGEFVDYHRFDPFMAGETLRVANFEYQVEFTNRSSIPATIIAAAIQTNFSNDTLEEVFHVVGQNESFKVVMGDHEYRDKRVVYSRRSGVVVRPDNRNELRHETVVFIRFVIRYVDPLNVRREISIAFTKDVDHITPVEQYGGADLNYDREITD